MSRPKYTKAEMEAARRDAAWLVNDTDTDERFKARALAGPCHCLGVFVCTRCKLEGKAS